MNPSHAFTIEEYMQVLRNTLLGFARVRMPSGMVLHDVGIHCKGDSVWASPASKPILGRDGIPLKDASAKLRFAFTVRTSRDNIADLDAAVVVGRPGDRGQAGGCCGACRV